MNDPKKKKSLSSFLSVSHGPEHDNSAFSRIFATSTDTREILVDFANINDDIL